MSRNAWLCIIGVAITVACAAHAYITNGTRRWFSDDLPSPEVVRNWTQEQLDTHLFELSRWDGFTSDQFCSFVQHQIHGLDLEPSDTFHYLEVGVGVGAFARYILHTYPNSTGVGVDLESKAIAIAKEVLPENRMSLLVANMIYMPMIESNTFDYVLVPGAICYLHSLYDVRAALVEFARVLKPGGGLCASMIASATSDMGSCNIRIPKESWLALEGIGLQLITMENMDDWNLPHGLGRYSTCLRKRLII